MVPARLSLRNFLCYGEDAPPLELEGIGLACLTGANGHGKSTLIDAITWSVWGKARGKTVDSLIHLGRSEMTVDFEFFVGANRYRVARRREQSVSRGTGRTNVQFYVQGPIGWQPLTGATASETDRLIENTVKLSYETFINSALLLQGKADLFTAAGPADRKRVLGEILGLDQYDALESAAKERRKLRGTEAAALARALADIEPQVALLPELEARQAELSAELDDVKERAVRFATELAELQKAQRTADIARQQLEDAERRAAGERSAIEAAERELAELATSIAADERLAAAEQPIRDGYAALQAARAAAQRLNEAHVRDEELKAQISPLQQRIARAQASLEAQVEAARREINELTPLVALREQLERALPVLEAESSAYQEREMHLTGLQQQAEGERREVALLEEESARLLASAEQKRARVEDLRAAEQRGDLDCPLCRTRLGADGLHHIEVTWTAEGKAETDRIRQNRARVAELRAEADRIERNADTIRLELEKEKRQHDAHLGRERLRLEQARTAEQRLAERRAALDEAARQLADGSFAEDARRQAATLEAERLEVGFSLEKLRAATERVDARAHYEEKRNQLEQALGRLEANRRARASLTAAQEERRGRLTHAEETATALRASLAEQPDLAPRIAELEQCAIELRERDSRLHGELGGLKARIDNCRDLDAIGRTKKEALEVQRREEAIFDDLARAFGRNGVQALIIDSVLPEVEEEANRLLGSMTSGHMTVRLDTQSTRKSGDAYETLEVRIGDEWGTRDYEMYSGGEAFRINLALRIALAKLLARRSGAPLPTLIIDEGFGSQDAAGQERLVEAVMAIKDDFECMLVVTHIEEMKLLFDTRIMVEKLPTGSHAWVEHA